MVICECARFLGRKLLLFYRYIQICGSVRRKKSKTARLFSLFLFELLHRLLGLCNNFAYVVMLSAAHDILEKQESENSTTSVRKQRCFLIKSTDSITDVFLIHFFLFFTFQAPPELVGNVPSGNKSNSSGYDCSPVSTGVRGDQPHLWDQTSLDVMQRFPKITRLSRCNFFISDTDNPI